ncbi:MAG: hypothetical protein HY962_13945 [Ignavibacteriae bacterium]|nr:hypothetical protein [Ignavibacteriota bacterium]
MTNWSWYARNKLVRPATFPYTRYTMLHYAFFAPQTDGRILLTDPWADKNLLLGDIDWSVAPAGYDSANDFGNPAYHRPGTSLVAHAHVAGVPITASVGGWTLSTPFPALAATAATRARFAHECGRLVRAFSLDGIDIDWEYPGYTSHGGGDDDYRNFTLLMRAVRDTLDVAARETARRMYLTAALGCVPALFERLEWAQLGGSMDWLNLMTYDFSGPWDATVNHHAALYASPGADPSLCIDAAVRRLTQTHGVDPAFIVLGIPFYGHALKTRGPAALHAPALGQADAATFPDEGGAPPYHRIITQRGLFTEHWDSVAAAPYMLGTGGLTTFVTYDNPRSAASKAVYARTQRLRGVFVWEASMDCIETAPGSGIIAATPLIDTIRAALDIPTHLSTTARPISDRLLLYPQPAGEVLHIDASWNVSTDDEYLVTDMLGRVHRRDRGDATRIPLAGLPAGSYLLLVYRHGGAAQCLVFVKH